MADDPQFLPIDEKLDPKKRVDCWLFGSCGQKASWKRLTRKRQGQPGESGMFPHDTQFLCAMHAAIQMRNKK